MRIKQGKKPEKETICWDCQNYSCCSWSRGKPVKGWKATPTIVENIISGYPHVVESFLVEACPQFLQDKKRRILLKDVAVMLGMGERALYRFMRRKGRDRLGELLKEKGYKLHVVKGDEQNQYFIEKI